MIHNYISHPIDSNFEFLSIRITPQYPNVVVVSLNRPSKRNAINTKMWREIGDAFRSLGTFSKDNPCCRCILLHGTGKNFCSGIDITDPNFGFADMSGDSHYDDSQQKIDVARKFISFHPKILEMQQCFTAVEECSVPVVAAIHGSCIGGGMDLICCADIRVCTPDTKFSIREVKLGLAADVGTLQRLPKIVGHSSRVRQLCYTGEDFDGSEAERIGLVSKLSSKHSNLDDVLLLALEICEKIAGNSPVAVYGTKLSLNFSRDHSVQEGLGHIAMHNAVALMTDDLSSSFIESEFSAMLPHAKL